MKAFFEHFAAILGAATLALLVVSVSHEYGYFSSVGRQFQTFLTTTDYLSNSVPYLPGILGIAWISVRFWKFEDKAPRKVTWIDAAIIVVSLVLGMIFLTLPLEFDVVGAT